MYDSDLFERALGLQEAWQVVGVSFDAEERRLDVRLDFERGARFACPECERAGCEVHDTSEKTWRHLDFFFQHQAYLTARVPRVRCPEHGVHQVKLSWACEGSGFTLLFEALAMALCSEMPIRAVADMVGEHDTRIWRVVHYYVDRAREREDLSGVQRVGIDDTSFRRGQDYVTLFADLDERRCVFATPGRDASTVKEFAEDLNAHGAHPDQVGEVCQDMSQAYLSGVLENLQRRRSPSIATTSRRSSQRPSTRSAAASATSTVSCSSARAICGCADRRTSPRSSARAWMGYCASR